MSENTGAMSPPICEHHYVSIHQPDFPALFYWVAVCSLCGDVDAAELAKSVAWIEGRVRENVAREIEAEANVRANSRDEHRGIAIARRAHHRDGYEMHMKTALALKNQAGALHDAAHIARGPKP